MLAAPFFGEGMTFSAGIFSGGGCAGDGVVCAIAAPVPSINARTATLADVFGDMRNLLVIAYPA